MKKNKDTKYRAKLSIIYLIAYSAILMYFYCMDYISFNTLRNMYMPIIGFSMIALILNYMVFGQVFLLSSLFGLISEYIYYINSAKEGYTANTTGQFTNNVILILGFTVGFIVEMYIKAKNKNK